MRPIPAALAALLASAAPVWAQAAFPYEKRVAEVLGTTMAYVDTGPDGGDGPAVLMLHGNPTSSYLWRNVIPHVADDHRVIAPDLIGMGDSGKPDIAYTYADHAMHLDALLAELDLDEVVLVVHDWGSVLGMEIARGEEGSGRVRGLAFMEAIIPPALPAPSLEAMGERNGELFAFLRSDEGQEAILQGNFFVEEILGKVAVATPLPEDVMDAYRAPFPTPESRRPTAEWPRQVPIAGEPAETAAVIAANGDWLYSTDLPKLMLSVVPGALMPPPVVAHVEANASNLTHVALGAGVHFVQEDHPDAIGRALSDWLATLPEAGE
ncbi:haloalkane dehalogenase [Jannaschia sp. Os4]|uniref:haloalkane dehalogenase n=1 Tax=Jannaschia sp. Os4 TaxID=2807617 RepID=UPI0019399170|nr:haloalkane dehalogenase [Jannaschia sp. Os4]MBM2576076.1 haloalkane dehalogenase [Jannaschia sp. Os4]